MFMYKDIATSLMSFTISSFLVLVFLVLKEGRINLNVWDYENSFVSIVQIFCFFMIFIDITFVLYCVISKILR